MRETDSFKPPISNEQKDMVDYERYGRKLRNSEDNYPSPWG